MSDMDLQALVSRFLDAQLRGDRRAALAVMNDGIATGSTVLDLQAHVVRAAQEEIGNLWQANRISVAQEHLATGISQLALAHLFEHAPPVAANGKRVAVACVEGEQHDLPARLVADYLEHHGFAVHYFGCNVPTEDLVRAVAKESPHLLALSATMSFHLPALQAAVTAVRAVAPHLPILVGGHAVRWSPAVVEQLRVHTAPGDPDVLVETARRLTQVA